MGVYQSSSKLSLGAGRRSAGPGNKVQFLKELGADVVLNYLQDSKGVRGLPEVKEDRPIGVYVYSA